MMGSLVKNRMDDLLSADVGKHDYDWLLTPPGTPAFSFSESSGNPSSKASPRSGSRSNARSVSAGKTTRFPVSRAEHATSVKPARSSSTTRSSSISVAPSSSSTFYSNNSRTAILSTSTASRTSKHPAATAAGNRHSKPTSTTPSHSASSHYSTPVKTRPSTPDKPRPAQNSRPRTPPVRPQASLTVSNCTSSSATAAGVRPNSRPSTPTRSNAAAPLSTRSASVGRAPVTNSPKGYGAPAMRPNSPASRTRASAQPLALPERAVSAGRQLAGATALSLRGSSKSETAAPAIAVRRQSASPLATRGRLQENSSGNRMNGKANEGKAAENRKQLLASEAAARRSTKQASPTENGGFGRSISKKSMDLALKHMDIRQSMASGIRGTALFPQSIRSAGQKARPGHSSEPPLAPSAGKQSPQIDSNGGSSSTEVRAPSSDLRVNGVISAGRNGDLIAVRPSNDQLMVMARKISKLDIYESSRYDLILQKEDSKNMNWLHSIEDDKCDQSPSFDYRFGSLPEPFGLI